MKATSSEGTFRAGRHEAAAIPFVDLGLMHRPIRDEIVAALAEIVDTSAFVGGPRVEAFEREFARLCGVRHAVAVGNGTDALRIALQCAGVRPGDAVISVSMTFFATTEGILQVGAKPVLLDVDEATSCMDPAALAAFLEGSCRKTAEGAVLKDGGARIGAILPVHLYGLAADMAAIGRIADEWGIPIVEDAAQAHGATADGLAGRGACGSFGVMSSFSFYPSKNLGAMGEAGAVTTDDGELAERARMLREHGQSDRYRSVLPDGSNARLDAMQAAVLSVKLRHLRAWTEERREAAAIYDAMLDDAGIWRQGRGRDTSGHVYHLYVVQVDDRESVRAQLSERGIATGIHYPIAVHQQPAMAGVPMIVGAMPHTERLAARCLSLPMYPGLEEDAARRVAEALIEVTRGG